RRRSRGGDRTQPGAAPGWQPRVPPPIGGHRDQVADPWTQISFGEGTDAPYRTAGSTSTGRRHQADGIIRSPFRFPQKPPGHEKDAWWGGPPAETGTCAVPRNESPGAAAKPLS